MRTNSGCPHPHGMLTLPLSPVCQCSCPSVPLPPCLGKAHERIKLPSFSSFWRKATEEDAALSYVRLRRQDFPVGPSPPGSVCPQLKSEAMSRFGMLSPRKRCGCLQGHLLLGMESSQLQGWPHVPAVQEGEEHSVLCLHIRSVYAALRLLLFCCGPVPGGCHFP